MVRLVKEGRVSRGSGTPDLKGRGPSVPQFLRTRHIDVYGLTSLILTSSAGSRHNIPRPCKLTFNLLTLKVVSESRVTWATSVPDLVFLSLSILDLGPMYATDSRQTRVIAK